MHTLNQYQESRGKALGFMLTTGFNFIASGH